MSSAYPIAVRNDARPPGRRLAALGLALLAGWTLYAVPGPRARVVAALRPWLAPAPAPITFGPLSARRGEIDGQPVLYVEGSMTAAAARAMKAPSLRVALIGDDGRAIYTWKAKPARPQLEPGRETPFQTRLLAPPETFKSIAVTVAEEK